MGKRFMKLLIIDDEKGIYDSLVKILSSKKSSSSGNDLFEEETESASELNFEFYHADQGEKGVSIFKEHEENGNPFDLVICDVRMPPGIDGKETLKRISQIDNDVQAIVCSAFSDHSIDEIEREMEGDTKLSLLEKPFRVEDVKEIVKIKVELIKLLSD